MEVSRAARAFVKCFKRHFSAVSEPPKFNLKTITLPSISNRHNPPISYKMSYVDTAKNDLKGQKTVLLLHGTPGSHQDFHFQIPFLENKGFRVICPDFPGYQYAHVTKRQYRHTPQDRADFVRSFLNEIRVDKIDLLVGHSSAAYPTIVLAQMETAPKIQSTALINPASHMICRVLKPLLQSYILVYLGERKWSYNILQAGAQGFLQKISPVKIKNIDHSLFALTTLMTTSFKSIQSSLTNLRDKKHPMLLIYSQNDKLFEPKVYEEMEKLLVPDKQLLRNVSWCYDDKGDIINAGTQKDWIKIVNLVAGSHYGMWKHPDIVNDNLLEMLERNN